MKILHVITSLQTGGAETLVVDLMPRFHALGHEVGVVVFNAVRTPLMERLEKECPKCKIYKLGSSYYNPWYTVKLWNIMRHYDIVHTHNSSPQLFVAIANLICKKKLVTTEHNTNNRKREYGGLLCLLDKWMYNRYHMTICISEVAKETLTNYLGGGQKTAICTINNGVDIDSIHNAEPLPELKTNRFVSVMVAGFREAKDQDTIIRAMGFLPNDQYELWLVGDGIRRHELEDLIKEDKLEGQVKLLGLRTDVPNILKTADVAIMSSHWEGLSLSNIEGMAAGKPFVASDVKGLREVTKGYGILFPHGDAKVLAEVISRLHDDKQYYYQISERCYERAKEFDISKMVEAYNQVYESFYNERK